MHSRRLESNIAFVCEWGRGGDFSSGVQVDRKWRGRRSFVGCAIRHGVPDLVLGAFDVFFFGMQSQGGRCLRLPSAMSGDRGWSLRSSSTSLGQAGGPTQGASADASRWSAGDLAAESGGELIIYST